MTRLEERKVEIENLNALVRQFALKGNGFASITKEWDENSINSLAKSSTFDLSFFCSIPYDYIHKYSAWLVWNFHVALRRVLPPRSQLALAAF